MMREQMREEFPEVFRRLVIQHKDTRTALEAFAYEFMSEFRRATIMDPGLSFIEFVRRLDPTLPKRAADFMHAPSYVTASYLRLVHEGRILNVMPRRF